MDVKFDVFVDEKSRFIVYSSSCIAIDMSIRLTYYITMIENYVMKYYEKVYKRNDKTLFWSVNLHTRFSMNSTVF